jgi:hypothetical protein
VAVRTFVFQCWLRLRPDWGPRIPFTVACACGGKVTGVRTARHQLLPCPQCRKPIFVLPRSCWPAVIDVDLSATFVPPPLAPRRRIWRMPLLAGLVTLAVVVSAFALLLPLLTRQRPAATDHSSVVDEIRKHQALAKRALAEGKYHQALKEIDAAKDLSDRTPNALDRDERNRLDQLQRQSDVLDRLLSVPLQEIVKEASIAPDDEWRTRFADRYQDRSVLFDDLVRHDAADRPMLNTYEVRLGNEKVRLAVDELTLLRRLPLDPPRRLFFGARLAKVNREQGGWVIHFDPDSGVLFTDPDAALCVPLDEELQKVLAWQEKWLQSTQ